MKSHLYRWDLRRARAVLVFTIDFELNSTNQYVNLTASREV